VPAGNAKKMIIDVDKSVKMSNNEQRFNQSRKICGGSLKRTCRRQVKGR